MEGRLKDKYAIVGVGETEYSRASGRSTRALGVEAIRNAIYDAGLTPQDVDGMLSYHGGDSTPSTTMMYDLGMRLNFYMDCSGGGSSTEALIGLAIGAIEAGMCDTVAIFRAMNGYSQVRIGGTGARAAAPIGGSDLLRRTYGVASAVQSFAFTFTRHMMEYGVTGEDLANIKVTHSNHASNNPKALMKQRVTVDDVVNSRWIVKPCAHLLDCCLETDNATCIIVTSAERAKDLRHPPAYIMAVQGRGVKPGGDFHYQYAPISRVAGYYVGPRLFELAGVTHDDIDVTGCYDAFTYTTLLQFEDYGFCEKGEGKDYVNERHHEPGRQASEQHERRAPVRRVHARHEHGHREYAADSRHGGRLLPELGGWRAYLRLLGGRMPSGPGCEHLNEHGLGDAGRGKRADNA